MYRTHLSEVINACAGVSAEYQIHISSSYLEQQKWDGNAKGVAIVVDDAIPPKTIGMFLKNRGKHTRYDSSMQEKE